LSCLVKTPESDVARMFSGSAFRAEKPALLIVWMLYSWEPA